MLYDNTHTHIYAGATGVTTDSTGVNHCDNSRPNLCLEEGIACNQRNQRQRKYQFPKFLQTTLVPDIYLHSKQNVLGWMKVWKVAV